jgi:hypothetical protein
MHLNFRQPVACPDVTEFIMLFRGRRRSPLSCLRYGAQFFNDGAGMNTVGKMAAFVGRLTPQNAYDLFRG